MAKKSSFAEYIYVKQERDGDIEFLVAEVDFKELGKEEKTRVARYKFVGEGTVHADPVYVED